MNDLITNNSLDKKHLLIIYHSKNGNTGKMADAVLRGARHPEIEIEVKMQEAKQTGLDELLWADGLILGTPENFGYMSGALKDFFDRTFYPAEGKVEGLPYCIFISAGNDGSGALASIRRICKGFPFKEVQQPVIAQGKLTQDKIADCQDLGTYMAAGLEGHIF
ncbi:MAG: flavodoxin family protein [Pseudomonadales bacterium]|nr:flavodoxin family protein [Pseudomonadales bacterium]